jgi:predicted DNA-binding transcriptional regulator YafY
MGKSEQHDATPTLTSARVARLYKMLNLLEGSTRARATLLKRLDLDLRSFYRDVESLRDLGIKVEVNADKYTLGMTITEALALLPFPDPGLSFADVLQLSKECAAPLQKKLRSKLLEVTKNGH